MSELFEVGQRVRVRLDLQCPQEGKIHGWATEGRTGTVMWIEPNQPDQHFYVIGYFSPTVVVPGFSRPFSPQFHNWFAPWELESVEKE